MDVTLEDAGPCRKVMRVRAGAQEVRDDYAKLVNLYAKQAKVAGFRKGKAPATVIERQFKDGLAEHAKEELVPRLYHDALKQENVSAVAIVGVTDVQFSKDEGIDFKVTLDVAPQFKLPRYKKISLKRQKVEVEDKQVDETVDRIRESRARFEDVDSREVRDGDLVKIDYSGTCEGKPFAEVAPENSGLGEGTDFLVLVGGVEIIPGLGAGLVGAAIGDKRTVDVAFPEDYRVEPLAGKQAVFDVEIKGIREKTLPELDESLLKEFEVESEDELRGRCARTFRLRPSVKRKAGCEAKSANICSRRRTSTCRRQSSSRKRGWLPGTSCEESPARAEPRSRLPNSRTRYSTPRPRHRRNA